MLEKLRALQNYDPKLSTRGEVDRPLRRAMFNQCGFRHRVLASSRDCSIHLSTSEKFRDRPDRDCAKVRWQIFAGQLVDLAPLPEKRRARRTGLRRTPRRRHRARGQRLWTRSHEQHRRLGIPRAATRRVSDQGGYTLQNLACEASMFTICSI